MLLIISCCQVSSEVLAIYRFLLAPRSVNTLQRAYKFPFPLSSSSMGQL